MLLSKWYGKGIGKELSELSQLMESADQTRTTDQVNLDHRLLYAFIQLKFLIFREQVTMQH